MPFDKELPEWKKDNPDAKPAQSKLDDGFKAGERPAASMWNWFANRTYQALKQLFENAIHKETLGKPGGPAKLGANGKLESGQENATTPPDASLTVKGITMLSNSITGVLETKSATELAVKNAKETAINFAKSFGLGDVAKDISSTNLNNLDGTGFYMGTNLINGPGDTWYFIINLKHNDTYKTQLAIGFSTSGRTMLIRTQYNGVWTSWVRVLDESMINVPNGVLGLDASGSLPPGIIQGQFKKVLEFDVGGQATFSLSNLANYEEFEIVVQDLVGSRPTASNLNLVIAMNDDVPSLGQFGGLKTANGITGLFSSNGSTSNANLTTFQTPGTSGSFIINVTLKFKKMGYNTWKLTGETLALRNIAGVNSLTSTDYILGSFGGATAQLNKVAIKASDNIAFNSGRVELWVKN